MIIKPIAEAGRLIGRMDGHQFRAGCVILKPGEEVGVHSTEEGEEMIVLLEGTARITAGGEVDEVSAPAMVVIPPNTEHNVENESYKLLKYIYAVAMANSSQKINK